MHTMRYALQNYTLNSESAKKYARFLCKQEI